MQLDKFFPIIMNKTAMYTKINAGVVHDVLPYTCGHLSTFPSGILHTRVKKKIARMLKEDNYQ